jgi:Spy/CpxP family protein refolding chaperone
MMKKAFIGMVFCLLALGSMAQIRRTVAAKPKTDSLATAPEMGNDGAKRRDMLKTLQLDRQQKSKLKAMQQTAKQEKAAIEGDEKLTDAQKKQRLQELHKRRMSQMDTILTPEQKQQLLKMRQGAIKEKRGGKQTDKNGAGEMEIKNEQ